MYIHYRYIKNFKVNFYEVAYAILTLFGIDITMAAMFVFFFITATVVSWRTKDMAMWRKTGVWGQNPQPPTDFYGFHIKKTLI